MAKPRNEPCGIEAATSRSLLTASAQHQETYHPAVQGPAAIIAAAPPTEMAPRNFPSKGKGKSSRVQVAVRSSPRLVTNAQC
jgi:hypothetical protein